MDKLDTSNKYSGAYFETKTIMRERETVSQVRDIMVGYRSLPTSTEIKIYTNVDDAGYGSAIDTVIDTDRCLVKAANVIEQYNKLQVKVELIASGNNAPEVENLTIITT